MQQERPAFYLMILDTEMEFTNCLEERFIESVSVLVSQSSFGGIWLKVKASFYSRMVDAKERES